MINREIFRNIDENQYIMLKEALGLITILIGGADGEIDEQELNWAEKLTHIRTFVDPEELNDFYKEVEEEFDSYIETLLRDLPNELDQREEEISHRLTNLNEILNSLPNAVSYQLYTSYTSFAKHIAKASGGFLRFGSISNEEKKWINLPMINPVVLEVDETEDLQKD